MPLQKLCLNNFATVFTVPLKVKECNDEKVAIIMGSDSDFPVVSKAVTKLKEFGVPYEVHVMSAHRTPDAAIEFSGSAKKTALE